MAAAEGSGGRRFKQTPLWVTAATAALLALGFRRRRHESPERARHESPERVRRHAEREAEHGRFANTPSEIPARGWRDILWRLYDEINNDRILSIAGGVTFYVLLALFPGIAALVAIYGLFADPGIIAKHVDDLSNVMPSGALGVIRDELTRLSSKGQTTLGLTFLVGLAISLWSANAGMKALIDALNVAYAEREKRGLIKLNLLSFAFTIGAIFALMIGLGAVVVLPLILGYLGLGTQAEWVVALGKWPVLLIGVGFGISVLYRYGPSRNQAKWRWITWGSAFATVCWLIVSVLFSWYAANFGSYDKTYGSLGAVIGFMTWIWLSVTVMLLGAELDAEMEHQTFCDSTVGPPKPMGRRGAVMADTKGRLVD